MTALAPSPSPSPSADEPPPPAAVPPRPPRGLLTDSILETKWKSEEERLKQEEAPPPPPPPCVCADAPPLAPADDVIASDPYQAFASFTRIAAPTAALGRRDAAPASPLLDAVPPVLRGRDLPYSAASIAHRLMRYTYAKKNLAEFVRFFEGEFDNYHQVVEERERGVLPRDGGGHEHIHCSVVRLTGDLLFARYYFNGDPSCVFRSRLYKVEASDVSERGLVEMRIFRFYEETERRLKANNYDISKIEWDVGDVYDWLEGCEVYWELYEPEAYAEDEASETLGIEPGPRFVGYMEGGGCELYSREIGGRIKVMDDLLLTAEDLWVADRGFDEDDNFVYGNRRGVPYKMRRVGDDDDMAWTLSAAHPAPDGYVP